MKKVVIVFFMAFFVGGLFTIISPKEASAVPSFARQTQQPCFACHFQHIPKLNSFGRAFKLSGFTDTAQETIENMIVPSNVSIVTKFRYKKYDARVSTSPETDEFRGLWEFPNEMAAWFAGRISEHWGGAIEFPGPAVSGKFVYTNTLNKLNVGTSLFFTDALGPFFGIEPFNTGVVRNHRSFENRVRTSAAQQTGVGSEEATGVSFFANNDLFYASVGLWTPQSASADKVLDTNFDTSLLYRAAFTPTINNWDLMIGLFGTAGDSKCDCNDDGAIETYDTQAIGADFQAQGAMGDTSVEINGNFVFDTGNTANSIYTADANGYGANIELGFLGDVVGAQFGILGTDNAVASMDETAFSIGGWWNMSQNVSVQPGFTWISGNGRANDTEFILLLLNAF